jgi:hypothetical protein
VTQALLRVYRTSENLPAVGGLLRWTRREIADTVKQLFDAALQDHVDIDSIVARLDIDEVVARLDIGDVVSRLDIDAIVARLDIDEVVGRINLSRLANRVIEGVDLPGVVRKSATSIVRNRKSPTGK